MMQTRSKHINKTQTNISFVQRNGSALYNFSIRNEEKENAYNN